MHGEQQGTMGCEYATVLARVAIYMDAITPQHATLITGSTMIRNLAKACLPPALLNIARRLRPAPTSQPKYEFGVEQPAEFYDETFDAKSHWKDHYTQSRYYPVWTVIADRIRLSGCQHVLDIGCGPGQVACLLRDAGLSHYTGLDFSPKRIEQAESVCPESQFHQADVFATDLLKSVSYDCALILEVLEHVEDDVGILKRLKPGTRTLCTVPSFPAAGHVRHFKELSPVEDRYVPHFESCTVTKLLTNKGKTIYWLIDGVTR